MSTWAQAFAAFTDLKTIPDRVVAIVRAWQADHDKTAAARQWSESHKEDLLVQLRDAALAKVGALWDQVRTDVGTIQGFEPGPLGDPDPVVRELRTSRCWDRIQAAKDAGRDLVAMVDKAAASRELEMFAALLEFAGDDRPEIRGAVVRAIVETFPESDHARQMALIEWTDLRFDEARNAISQARSEISDGKSVADEVRVRTSGLASLMARRDLEFRGIPEPVA